MAVSQVAQTSDLELLEESLASDLSSSIAKALAGGAIFESGASPLEVFQHAVDGAVRDIHHHPRGQLLQRFITQGPYEGDGEMPVDLVGKRLADEDTAKAIRFLFSWVVVSFQGRLAELLAAGPVFDILERLKEQRRVPEIARLFVGDVVAAPDRASAGRRKAADLHVLSLGDGDAAGMRVSVHAVGEVKSYLVPEERLRRQLAQHAWRCRSGLTVQGTSASASSIDLHPDPPIQILVAPARWPLSRAFHFEETNGRSFLHVESDRPPVASDQVDQLADGAWRVTLRWSHEALAAAAYGLSFWYIGRIGEVAFANGTSPWPEMSPADAGRNAAQQSLYYAILRSRSGAERNPAVALYNMFGFGYALGMNFRGPSGDRRMLWPEDLRAILRDGVTHDGCTIRGGGVTMR